MRGGEGMNVKNVYLTAEVADKLQVNQAYLLRTAKDLKLQNKITDTQMRESGKRNYIFSEEAVKLLEDYFKSKKKS